MKIMTEVQALRLLELSDAMGILNQAVRQVATEGYQKEQPFLKSTNKQMLERALGQLYAVAGRMASEQDISWTEVCECACKKYDKEKANA